MGWGCLLCQVGHMGTRVALVALVAEGMLGAMGHGAVVLAVA